MVEFNEDGSIRLPVQLANKIVLHEEKLKKQRCIKVQREVLNSSTPKSCRLVISLSAAITDPRFIHTIYDSFKSRASVPSVLKKLSEMEYSIEIGTDFRRCSDCNSLIGSYREFLDGNLIDEKGTCTFEKRMREFSYEDYFD